jgi:6-phosphofructokinase 2
VVGRSHADFVVASGSLLPGVPEDFFGRLARRERELGSRLTVDTSGEALLAAAKAGVHLLKPNMREVVGQLAGHEIEDLEDQVSVAQEILGQGQAEAVVVSLWQASRRGSYRTEMWCACVRRRY